MQTLTLTSRREIAPAVFELLFTRPEDWPFKAGSSPAWAFPSKGPTPSFAPTRSRALPKRRACAFS